MPVCILSFIRETDVWEIREKGAEAGGRKAFAVRPFSVTRIQ